MRCLSAVLCCTQTVEAGTHTDRWSHSQRASKKAGRGPGTDTSVWFAIIILLALILATHSKTIVHVAFLGLFQKAFPQWKAFLCW